MMRIQDITSYNQVLLKEEFMSKWLILGLAALTISTTTVSAGCRTCGSNWGSRNYSNSQHRQARLYTYYSKNSNYRDRRDDQYACEEDREIIREIHKGLQAQGYDYSQNNVHVTVEYGKVVFDGRVDSETEKAMLRDVAVNLHGVNHVIVDVYVDDIDPNPQQTNRRTMDTAGFRR